MSEKHQGQDRRSKEYVNVNAKVKKPSALYPERHRMQLFN